MERRSADRIATAARGRSRGTGAGGGHGRGRPSRRSPSASRTSSMPCCPPSTRAIRPRPSRACSVRPTLDAGPPAPSRGCAVLSTCDLEAAGLAGPDVFPAAFVDMAGPGAERSPFGSTIGVVLRFVPAPGVATEEARSRGAARVVPGRARPGREHARGRRPIGSSATAGRLARADDDPAVPVVAIVQVASEGPFVDTFLRGAHLRCVRADRPRPASAADRGAHERRPTTGRRSATSRRSIRTARSCASCSPRTATRLRFVRR